jgi:hypothetical protein
MRGGDRDRRRRSRVGRGDEGVGGDVIPVRGGGEGPTRQRRTDQGATGGKRFSVILA